MPKPKETQAEPVDEGQKPSEVSIELDEKNQPIKPPETPKEEPKYVTAEQLAQTVAEALKKATAPLYYEMRKAKETPQIPTQPAKPTPEPTEWDTKLQKDWKGTVEELAEARLNAILQKREEAARIESERQRNFQLLESNKSKVLERHKELNDENSNKSEIYRGVLQEHPEYLSNPFGPVLAMRDMEDKMKEMGIVDEPTRQVVNKEVARQARANGASVPNGTSVQGNSKVVLTKDQKDFCDSNGIKYENYAKFFKQAQGGIEA